MTIDPLYVSAVRKKRIGQVLTPEEADALAAEEAATEKLARAEASRRYYAENKDKVAERLAQIAAYDRPLAASEGEGA